MMPGQISQLYQPVPNADQYYVVDRAKEAEYFRKRVPVTIAFKMGKYETDKVYMVPEDKARIIVNIANIYNVTKERMSVTLTNVRRSYTKAKVILSNFRLRR